MLEDCFNAKLSKKKIAQKIGMSLSTVYRELERGTNERLNRDIRKIFPKGTDFSKVSDKQVQRCEDWVNHYPREIFAFGNSAERFEAELAKIA